ncbi:MAG: hypothetical protein CSB46_04000 [Micrococcales bacterium]|nr:MAG: hypothetical protein CSB46_04000 [Micrococcales bacterium]
MESSRRSDQRAAFKERAAYLAAVAAFERRFGGHGSDTAQHVDVVVRKTLRGRVRSTSRRLRRIIRRRRSSRVM